MDYLTKCPEHKAYLFKSENPVLKQIVRQSSFLGEIEKRVCRTLDITKPWQHELSYPYGTNFKNAKNVETGNLTFAKENSFSPGTKLINIRDELIFIYKTKGFAIQGGDIEKEKTIKELHIPEDHYQNAVLIAEKEKEKYQINIWQGDEYSVDIMKN